MPVPSVMLTTLWSPFLLLLLLLLAFYQNFHSTVMVMMAMETIVGIAASIGGGVNPLIIAMANDASIVVMTITLVGLIYRIPPSFIFVALRLLYAAVKRLKTTDIATLYQPCIVLPLLKAE